MGTVMATGASFGPFSGGTGTCAHSSISILAPPFSAFALAAPGASFLPKKSPHPTRERPSASMAIRLWFWAIPGVCQMPAVRPKKRRVLRTPFKASLAGPVVLSSGAMAKDTLTITDNRTGKSYELPITEETIRAADLRQIKVDDGDFGLMAYDP